MLAGSHTLYLCHVALCEFEWYSSRARCIRTHYRSTHPLLLEWGHNAELAGVLALALATRNCSLQDGETTLATRKLWGALQAAIVCAGLAARAVLLSSRTILLSRETRASSGLAALAVSLPPSAIGMWAVAAAHAHAIVVPCNALVRTMAESRCVALPTVSQSRH